MVCQKERCQTCDIAMSIHPVRRTDPRAMILVMTVRTLLLKCPIVMPWWRHSAQATHVYDHPLNPLMPHTHLQVDDADVLVHHGPPPPADERLLQVDGLKQLRPVVQHHLTGQTLGQLVCTDVLLWVVRKRRLEVTQETRVSA